MRSVALQTGLLFGLGALALIGCKNTTTLSGGSGGSGGSGSGAGDPSGGSGGGGNLPKATKVDILFDIDNSRSMADKQQILTLALDDLITGLTTPPCLDPGGKYVSQPGALVACPAGSTRQYAPVGDIHIGIVSSSLGGHGSDACAADGAGKASNNDKGHLLSRSDPTTGEQVPTYQNSGFLAWDPTQKLAPPGEASPAVIVQSFRDMVLGVGQIGCGYEAQLESWYRFLADPEPAKTVTLDAGGSVVLSGLDTVLLDQRKAFLRPDSMLVIVSLSDENDCSIREEGQYYFAAQQKGGSGTFHLPRARALCATSPTDPCCFSCGMQGPEDENGNPLCPDEPACKGADGSTAFLDDVADPNNLRCFEQKRRFGIDFLYPVERYVSALTSSTVMNRSGQLVANPIFSDLDSTDEASQIRDPGLVVLAGIVGVPWQDIAKNPEDLKQGFKTSAELTQENAGGQTTWDIVLGDFANAAKPLDPFMQESILPRSGTNPVTGTSITPPGGAPNPINGAEWTVVKKDDLQYACIMPVPEVRDCAMPGTFAGCDCEDMNNDSALCGPNPADSGNPTLQVRAKAYPSLRQLSVLKGIGNQAVVGSICATQITDPTLPDYAYRPVVASLIDRMKTRLR
jgi:hypothetical protein